MAKKVQTDENVKRKAVKLVVSHIYKKLHTGRSRNDQVALDTRMYVRDETGYILKLLDSLMSCLLEIAENNLETIMPGYTHLQKAQPVTLAHHLMAYYEMFNRDFERLNDCLKRVNIMPLGSGALAGTTYPIDREMVMKELKFESLTKNSMDGVSDRDFVIETVFCLSMVMMHISRLSEEIILWSTGEFGFIELSDKFSTGSSIMPQKKNPDMAELSRGKSARVTGNLITLLTLMKSLPLSYNKDMQEDKPALFDTLDNVKMCIEVFTPMLNTAVFQKERMLKAAKEGFSNATDLADYLVGKGLAFRDAHEITGKIVSSCISKNLTLDDLTLDIYKSFSSLIEVDVYISIDILNCVKRRDLPGGPAPSAVRKHIEEVKALKKNL